MSALERRSPDGKVAIRLRYEGEVRFGPLYFSCVPVHFPANLKDLSIGQDIDWKPDSSSCVMLVFHSLESNRPPDTELIRVDVKSGAISSIERNTQGMIHMGGFDRFGEYSYEVVFPTQPISKNISW